MADAALVDALRVLHRELVTQEVDEIPAGCMTFDELAKELRLSRDAARPVVELAIAKGIVKELEFRQVNGYGRRYTTKRYMLNEAPRDKAANPVRPGKAKAATLAG